MGRFQFHFVVLLIATIVILEFSNAKQGYVPIKGCPYACSVRCSATHHRGQCMDVCQDCCGKCSCVSSGAIGNKNECPCYRDMKTKYGKPKCP
uniref:peamaclein-like n=1 Tax=Erigeron canadensis TaxID=72917 RepID=UPI001CB961A6|nr:peamaclein-like [Erigeron canadensis]